MDLMQRRREMMMGVGQNESFKYVFAYSAKDGTRDVVNASANETRILVYGGSKLAGQYTTYPASTGYSFPVIKIPTQAKSITIDFSKRANDLYNGSYGTMYWMKNVPYTTGSTYALYMSLISYNPYEENTRTFAIPENADSFLFAFRMRTNAVQDTAKATAEYVGLTIVFNEQ